MATSSDPVPASEQSFLQGTKVSFGVRSTTLALRMFKGPTSLIIARMPKLRDNLLRSNLLMSPEVLVSTTLLYTFLSLPVSLLGIYLVVHGLIWGVAFVSVPAFVLPIGLLRPKVSQSGRADSLDQELHFIVGYLSVLSGGGVSPFVSLRRLSVSRVFPAMAREAKRILMHVDIFGLDPISALEMASRYNPNKAFSELISGYVTVLKTGGDVINYLETKVRDTLSYKIMRSKSFADTISTFAEAYITVSTVLGISIFVLFAVQMTMGNMGSQTTNLPFMTFFIPLISIVFLFAMHNIQPKDPFSVTMTYKIFAVSCFAIPVFLFSPVQFPLYMKVALGLSFASIPAAIVNFKEDSERKGVESMLPNLVRDLAEVTKTGLSPERSIQLIAERPYGKLGKHLKTISYQLSWGVPLQKVLLNFSKKVKSWSAQSIAFLLIEVVDVGGGSEKMFSELADFIQSSSELEKEKRSLLRPYLIVPYIGAVLVVISTVLSINFMTTPLSSSASLMTTDLKGAMSILLSGAILQAWAMGIVGGKMGEGSIAAGFKHGTALALISLAAILVVGLR